MARPPYRGNSYNDDMLCKLAEAFAAKFPAEGQAMENAFKTKNRCSSYSELLITVKTTFLLNKEG